MFKFWGVYRANLEQRLRVDWQQRLQLPNFWTAAAEFSFWLALGAVAVTSFWAVRPILLPLHQLLILLAIGLVCYGLVTDLWRSLPKLRQQQILRWGLTLCGLALGVALL